MKNPLAVTRLVEIEIETKIKAALLVEMQGKQVSDMGKRDFAKVSDRVKGRMSPAAREKLIEAGVLHAVKAVFGEKIAERIWQDGTGWATSESRVREIATELKFSDLDEAIECLEIFKEDAMDADRDEVDEKFPSLARFTPLFVAQPADATLGEIATRKAMFGDKLALSFLAWKEIA